MLNTYTFSCLLCRPLYFQTHVSKLSAIGPQKGKGLAKMAEYLQFVTVLDIVMVLDGALIFILFLCVYTKCLVKHDVCKFSLN